MENKVFDLSFHFKFKDSTNSFYAEEKADRAFLLMKDLGISWFNTWCNDDVYPASETEDRKMAEGLALRMAQENIRMSSFHFVGSVLDCYDRNQGRVRSYMERSVNLFRCCKPASIVLHPGTFAEGGFRYNKMAHKEALERWGEEETYAMLVENLQYFGDLAKEAGTRLAVENIFQGRFYSRIEELIQLVRDVDRENVGFCLDTGHANVDGVDIPVTIGRMGDKLFEVHFHDNNGKQDQHLPVGFGTIDWCGVIAALNRIQYQGTATFEFFRWPLPDYRDGLVETIRLWRTLESITYQGYRTTEWG